MKLSQSSIALVAAIAIACFTAPNINAQFGGMLDKSKVKGGEAKVPTVPSSSNKTFASAKETESSSRDGSDERAENAKKLAKAAGMPKAANSDAVLNKLLFQAADDHRLIPRKVVITDKDWFTTTGAHNAKVRRIFAVLGRTLDDGSGKCGKQMVQFDQDWKEEKNAWGLIYVQNIGEVTPIACSAIGK